jgi:alkanesulfonate monooxygenase SsuD/methylene tetrahydromethanopterin reductase-like flavin-dependent oxidoreductase (luciferase family)
MGRPQAREVRSIMQVFGNQIRFGVQATPTRISYEDYLANWQSCERLGYDVTYVVDHFVLGSPESGWASIFESTTLLSAMFTQTTRMRGGIMVAGNTFRNPGVLAKIATTLDNISGGRLELGMGSGHTEIEHQQYNVPFYTQGRRIRMLGESVKVVRSLLSQDRTTFAGEYYTYTDAVCEPKPVQQPLPILIGGIGEQLSMRVVAESADIWNNWTSPDLETYEQKISALHRHCSDVGRNPNDIRKSMHIKPLVGENQADIDERAPEQPRNRWQGTPEQLIEHLLEFVKLGVSDFVFMLDYPADIRSLELIATKVAPEVRSQGSR